ncbi:MAG: hypothetical protein ACQEQ7_12765 [Thermodesulfobacteriota bacterium]
MKKGILQAVLVLSLLALFGGIYLVGQHILSLPFAATNKSLHEADSALTLDFLIPAGTYLDEDLTIAEVIRLRFKKQSDPFEELLRTVCAPIPVGYKFLANVLLFCFWTLCCLTLFRVFTFMGYGRALRGSLFFGGIAYYFMPDIMPGKLDDTVFLLFPVLIILLRFYAVRRKNRKVFKKE